MLHFIHSNRMEVLCQAMIEQLNSANRNFATNDLKQLFQPNTILVQSPGMAQWLKLQIAEANRVAANIEFPLPSSFIWRLYQHYFDDLPEQSDFNKDAMSWKLFQLLPELLNLPEFELLKHYLSADLQESDIRRYQLCTQIADIYDQYLVYRPEWIEQWEQGDYSNCPPEQLWQPVMWQKLVELTTHLQQSPYHRANLHQQLIDKIAKNPSQDNSPLYIFGISVMPQQQLEVLTALAQQKDVFIFWLNPCEQYWGDVVNEKQIARIKLKHAEKAYLTNLPDTTEYLTSGNPLLASWGQLGREYLEWQLEQDTNYLEFFVEAESSNLLATIQNDILSMTQRGELEPLSREMLNNNEGKLALLPQDQSLQFHSCHSEMRELEVLQDQLLNMMKLDTELTPKDILVMMPDVGRYLPYINAVFGSASSELYIPFAISDQNKQSESLLIESFTALLNLPEWRFSQSDILQLLEVPALQRQFDIPEYQVQKIQRWLNQVAVRWGLDSDHKQQLGLPADHLNTWAYGIERLLTGYAFAVEERELYQHILPEVNVEGSDAELLGILIKIIEILKESLSFMQQQHSIDQFSQFLLQLIDSIYCSNEYDESELLLVREAILSLQQHQLNCGDQISYAVARDYLLQQLQQSGVGQRFLAGQMNFCTLMPMRSIPFKVVCLVGMNDAEYPRLVHPIGFDLISQQPRKRGDRSRRLDDRYLILEAILSAREKLYISYQGRSSRDNSERLPSILIDELMQYCQQNLFLADSDYSAGEQLEKAVFHRLTTEHYLQPFNRAYFKSTNKLPSYQRDWFEIANSDTSNSIPVKPVVPLDSMPIPESLDIVQFVQFFINPCRYFAQNSLGIRFPLLEEVANDDEPFEFSGLTGYQIAEQLVAQGQEYTHSEATKKVEALGLLPFHNFRDIALSQKRADVAALMNSLEIQNIQFQQQRVEICLLINDVKLNGWLWLANQHRYVDIRPGKVRAKDCQSLWIKHLLINAGDEKVESQLLATDKSIVFKPLETEQALLLLQTLVDKYKKGCSQALCYFPEASLTWVNKADLALVEKSFVGAIPGVGESSDPYINNFFPAVEDFTDDFSILAENILQPMQDAMEEIKYGS